jgi:hypothetical protein
VRRELPAVAAIAAVSTITAAPTAAATTITAVTTAAATATTVAATTSATRSLGLRTGFVDDEVPATKVLTVQAGYGAIRVFIAGDFDEGKTTRLARKPVTDQTNCRGANSQLTEPLLQLLF